MRLRGAAVVLLAALICGGCDRRQEIAEPVPPPVVIAPVELRDIVEVDLFRSFFIGEPELFEHRVNHRARYWQQSTDSTMRYDAEAIISWCCK